MGDGSQLPERYRPQEVEVRPQQASRQKFVSNPVVRFVGFASLFNLLLWLLALFAQVRGWVNVTASYFILLGVWGVGTLISVAAALASRVKRKWLAVLLASIGWALAVLILNAIAPKPSASAIPVTEVPTRQTDPKGRIRLLNYNVVPAAKNPAGFPAITFYYDNAGTDVVTGTVSRFGAGIGDGLLSDQAILAEQDKLLHWDGWTQAMARRKQSELRPNDPGEFTTIPNADDVLAKQFRKDFNDVQQGKKVFYAFITFKFFDSNGRVGVTETCSYFSLTFARHKCGRERTFYE